jgi:AraC-like DNA-binding protein
LFIVKLSLFSHSFKKYITQLRIEYLIKELKEEHIYRNYTIKYLAEEIGYTNASAFTRVLK